MTFGRRLKILMVEKGMRQIDVERETRNKGKVVFQSQVSRMVTDDLEPTRDQIKSLAKALKVPQKFLLSSVK